MNTSPTHPSNRSRALKIGFGLFGTVVAVAAVGLWLFLRDDSPEAVSLEAVVESTEAAVESTDTATSTEGESTAAGDIAGTWTLDNETGEFDYESATGSFVGFRIEEELNGVGSTTAVGRTGDVTGTMLIDGTTLTEASFEIDMTTITTNSSMRDDNVQDALETGEFPSASFVLNEPIELGEGAADGEPTSVAATGDLTVHGVTNEVVFGMDAQLVNGVVIAVGSTEITFADFGVEVPDGGPVISVDDFGVLELQFLLNPSADQVN